MTYTHAAEVTADRRTLVRYAWLSIAAAIATILLKSLAYLLTGSVGLLSDAMESLVNLMGAVMALVILTIAARPADDSHPYGHSKAEYFSSGVEGALIFIAALSIAYAAVERLINPQPIEQVGFGLAISAAASVINLLVGMVLLRVGRKHDSITLEADGHHLMTDVWTSVGVIAGVALVAVTDWQILDPLIAIAVAINILWTGYQLFHRSVMGLMDAALPDSETKLVLDILESYQAQHPEIDFHALRTRQAASRRFISLHLLVPGQWTVKQGHDLAHAIETEIQNRLKGSSVITHLEPVDDPVSYEDVDLDRPRNGPPQIGN